MGRAALSVLVVIAFAGAARAQFAIPNTNFLAPTQIWSIDTVSGHDSAEDAVAVRQRGTARSAQSSIVDVKRLAAATRYQPSAARRQANIRRFIARVRAQNPVSAAQFEQNFEGADVFATIDRTIAPYGMSSSNLADAFTLWLIQSWEAAHGITSSPNDPVVMAAVRRQALTAITASPRFAALDDATKQDMADEYLLLTLLTVGSMDYLAQHPDGKDAYARAVSQATRQSGLELDTMALTRDGLVARR